MSGTVPQNPTAQHVAALLPKLSDSDSDFRYMSLNDLYNILNNGHPGFLFNDHTVCIRTVDGLLKTLDDQNGEVQNLAIKCLGPLVHKVPSNILAPLIEKLSNLSTTNAIDNSIAATALRTVVETLPRPVYGLPPSKSAQDAYTAISRVLIPRLVGYNVIGPKQASKPPVGMLEVTPEKGVDTDALDVLTEIARCFGPVLQDAEIRALQEAAFNILRNDSTSTVVKKKAVYATSILAVYFPDELLSSFISQVIENLRDPHLTYSKRRTLIGTMGSMARSIPLKFGPYLRTLAPFVLSALSEQELEDQMQDIEDEDGQDPEADEVREAALVALDAFLSACGSEMRRFTDESIQAGLRFLRYDPNVANLEDDDFEDGNGSEEGFGDDEDFEEEGGFSDDDDMSWKVRRCAAKVLYTIISTRANGDLLEDGTLYEQIAPVLVSRFKEREDNVRLEILATMSSLVRKTGEGLSVLSSASQEDGLSGIMAPPLSRKRRRGSDTSMFDVQTSVSLSTGVASPAVQSPPASGPKANLADLVPSIITEVAKLLKGNSIPTKQASISLLRDIVTVQHGGFSDFLGQIMNPLVDAVKTTSSVGASVSTAAAATGSAASATGGTLRIEALALTSAIVESHPSAVVEPYLGKLVPAIVAAISDKSYKVSTEALGTTEQVIKALTPPRGTGNQHSQEYLLRLYDAAMNRVAATDADLEVRQRAIHALGVLLARTSGHVNLLSAEKRTRGLEVLLDRLRNETTRISAVRAIDSVAAMAAEREEFSALWVQSVALELGAQLRKADRSLRGASLGALKNLVLNPNGLANLNDETIDGLVDLLSPLLTVEDLHLLGPALVVLAKLAYGNAKLVAKEEINKALCTIVVAPLSGFVLDPLLTLVAAIGEQGAGGPLMQGLLKDVGVGGDPTVVGKALGTLLVHGHNTVGVELNDFVTELQSASDDQRKCLSLAVLGEAGLRLGSSYSLTPDLFISYFSSKSDQVSLAAAAALGRAGAGNVDKYLPVILSTASKAGNSQYLFLHSIKEILQHANEPRTNIAPFSKQIWDTLLTSTQSEDNKAVGAECLGRLAVVDPRSYLPLLQSCLQDRNGAVRSMAIQAIRYTFTDADDTYEDALRPNIISIFVTMLTDVDLENRRLALSSLNSAVHNKPELVLPNLGQLLPIVMKETNVRAELVREVQMGPFRHKVDDGLEVRKSAYETLYALMETAFPRINVSDFYDRVVAGLEDEHDIRVLCNLMLTKLIALAPNETGLRLDAIADRFRAILAFKPKDNAVKQELEKVAEANKGVIRVSLQLARAFPGAGANPTSIPYAPSWPLFWDWVRRDFASQLKAVEDESKSQAI